MAAAADRGEPDSVAWLHLSDFHFKPAHDGDDRVERDYGLDEVLRALLEDLKSFAGKSQPARGAERVPLDFVVVTGDISYSGKAEEYDRAAEFLRKVSEATDVPLERFFPVPGNHDVDRAKGLPGFMRATVEGRARLEEAWRFPATRRSIFGDKLAAYRHFVAGLNGSVRIPDEQPGGFCHRLDCRGRVVALLGLGSSWLSGADNERGRLLVGKVQAYDLAGGAGLESLGGADLRLALMHHPLDWMQEFDQADMTKLLAGHADLLLRGHLHETGLEWLAFPGRELRTIAAGSAYAGSRYRNAYNVTRVRFGDRTEVKVWLRAYAVGPGCFVKDVETYAAVEDGRWTWELPGTAGVSPHRRTVMPPTEVDVQPYLCKLRDQTRWLDIRGIGSKAAERAELERVYTRLRVAAPAAQDEADPVGERQKEGPHPLEDRPRDLELKDVLPDHPNMVLVGDPGAGKTTFLRFVALSLAQALLGQDREARMARVGLTGPTPFPIFVRLGTFGQYLSEHPDGSYPADSSKHFYRYLEYMRKGFHADLPEGFLEQRVLLGGCLLLLDGLDELPSREVRERVGTIVDELVREGRARGNRHLVTCRTRAYQGKVQLEAGFTRCHLVDFGPAEVEAFVTQWSRALFRVPPGEEGTAAADDAASYRRDLLAAIQAHPHVQPLTANPLLLTILAVVHWNRKKLPEQRADLYEAAVEYLLETREKQSEYESTLRKDCLKAVAVRMFEDPEGVRKTVGRREAAEAVRPLLNVDLESADAFIEDEELHSGLLVSRMEGEVEFWHPTFGEYLAALALAWEPDYWQRIRRHLYEERWNEVVLLLAGCRRRQGLRLASDFIKNILDADKTLAARARAVGLVGRILRDIGPAGGDPAQGTGYAEARQEALAVFEKGARPVAEPIRIEVGEALGQAGDPRIPEEDHANRVMIRGGSFWMGAQKSDPKEPGYDEHCDRDEAPVHRVTLSDFQIDRYPVTVHQFARFVDAASDGYLRKRFWRPEGWGWRDRQRRTRPALWEEQRRHPNRPVVNVSWYEADAYCTWVGEKTRWQVRLPTEAQWEFTARAPEARRYPWGATEPTDQHANFTGCVGHPTPVGIYPLGATPEGVQDLAGNVWEWCRDWFAPYSSEEQSDPAGPLEGKFRLLRGGGFSDGWWLLRVACRVNNRPESVRDYVGFRCVVAGTGGQNE